MTAVAPFAPAAENLVLTVASGDALDVRRFVVEERVSALFTITLVAMSRNPDVDFDHVVGHPATFLLRTGSLLHPERRWRGVCSKLQQVAVETTGLSTYQVTLVPTMWLLTQRRNHRIFQQRSEPEIVLDLLGEWGIRPSLRLDLGAYKKRKYRVQYAESDYAFACRMLEDAGIAFYFADDGGETRLVLSDAPQRNDRRAPPIRFFDAPAATTTQPEYVTSVHVGQQVRPGKYTLRDHDYRRLATYKLEATATGAGVPIEEKLERFHYAPGAFLFKSDKGGDTPHADDRGKHRTDEGEGASLAQKRLQAKRGSAKIITFDTNAHDLAPGVVMSMLDHPRADLGDGKPLLVVRSTLSGTSTGAWTHAVEARSADLAYSPRMATPKPRISGVESATVVGPAGEEIHTDEFGRVRVQFLWDREGAMDARSSCWIHVSQPWGGTGYGGSNLPRVGQEVLVDFLGGDPDRPIITGRVYTNLQKTPYKLPENKTQSGWKSNSSPTTGGYNEIMFEDKAGEELVNVQVRRRTPVHAFVKNDESRTVKNDPDDGRSGRGTTPRWWGTKHDLTIAPPRAKDAPPAPGPTKVTMVHERIELTTGQASIVLEGPNITLQANQNISVGTVQGNVAVSGAMGVGVSSPNTVVIEGAVGVYINCNGPVPPPLESKPSMLSTALLFALCPPLVAAQMGIHATSSPPNQRVPG